VLIRRRVEQEQRFYLLHLSLLREYLELEFDQLRNVLTSFKFDLECILDDFILFCFFVGNDFLPSLPSMYIPNGSLSVIFETYKAVLPTLGLPFSFSRYNLDFSHFRTINHIRGLHQRTGKVESLKMRTISSCFIRKRENSVSEGKTKIFGRADLWRKW